MNFLVHYRLITCVSNNYLQCLILFNCAFLASFQEHSSSLMELLDQSCLIYFSVIFLQRENMYMCIYWYSVQVYTTFFLMILCCLLLSGRQYIGMSLLRILMESSIRRRFSFCRSKGQYSLDEAQDSHSLTHFLMVEAQPKDWENQDNR